MTEQTGTTINTTVVDHNTSNNLIQQIALTNQVSVPWEDLKAILRQRLDQVLESDQLIYTESTITNPLTTKLAPLSSADSAGQVDIQTVLSSSGSETPSTQSYSLSATPSSTSSSQEPFVASQDPVQDQDNHVPEQSSTESNQKEEEKEKETEQKSDNDQTPEQQQSETKQENQVESESSTKENTENNNSQETGGDTASVSSEENKSDSGATPNSSTTASVEATDKNNDTPMIPVSKDTLLVETPEGYRIRINGLLDAFTSPPFTIQRVCELLNNPSEHHTNLIKYLRAVEKVLMITSSINEFSNPAYNGPSALDEIAGDEKVTTNGDYSRATNLDFSLISEEIPTSAVKEEGGGVAANNQEVDETTTHTVADGNFENVVASQENADKNDEDVGMEVERSSSGQVGADMDVDSSNGLNTTETMDGVEAENIPNESSGMELDQV
ncbi:protein phosphatase 4, regulatory subunit 2 [Haplosporangium sp. Z 27]|nr:protein phosphatase 4, regulatory subunit 2 [Haplosporangium sp. Z 27]